MSHPYSVPCSRNHLRVHDHLRIGAGVHLVLERRQKVVCRRAALPGQSLCVHPIRRCWLRRGSGPFGTVILVVDRELQLISFFPIADVSFREQRHEPLLTFHFCRTGCSAMTRLTQTILLALMLLFACSSLYRCVRHSLQS